MKALGLGIVASLFFAVTFILNHAMELSGGNWMWSASLRYFFMVPFLLVIVLWRKGLPALREDMRKSPKTWLIWSFVGFVLFYAPLTYAAAFGPGWLVAGMWQFTIIAGIFLAPLFLNVSGGREKIPRAALVISAIILIGIVLLHLPQAETVSLSTLMIGALPVMVAAFAYPLGNRKMMAHTNGRLDPYQRVLGMTLASLPIWLLLAIYATMTVGLPSSGQVFQSFLVGVSSGVVATVLFFMATDLARHNQSRLASVEATQSTEILFVVAGEMLLLGLPLPTPVALFGMAVIVLGMLAHSLHTIWEQKKSIRLQQKHISS
ncbi:multidrug resistance efflux transporter family protein [Chryseomicrobium palamuruense]|uniref:Multidrug resistance efflux transporter family protein n=1 Tax=Chryseomicrobium palamuruense TaxID=682973 RepID=A0ABV8USP4_9BACL